LRERFQASWPASGALTTQAKPLSREAIQNWIVEWLCRKLVLDPMSIETNRPLVDYGWKSLMAVNFALDLSRWSGRSISPLITWNFPTVDALTRHLQNGGQSSASKTEKIESDLGTLSDDELAKMLAMEIDLARSKPS
jgi:acyl carrier protein